MTGAPTDPPRYLQRAQAALEGNDPGDSAITTVRALDFVLCPRGANVWIRRNTMEVRFVRENGRASHWCPTESAPAIVWDMMGRLGVERIEEPLVGHLRASRSPLRPAAADAGIDLVGWIVPGPAEVVVYVRPLPEGLEPPEAMPVPGAGPWALPAALPPWRRAPVEYDRFFERRACTYCGHEDIAFRRVGVMEMGCTACGKVQPLSA